MNKVTADGTGKKTWTPGKRLRGNPFAQDLGYMLKHGVLSIMKPLADFPDEESVKATMSAYTRIVGYHGLPFKVIRGKHAVYVVNLDALYGDDGQPFPPPGFEFADEFIVKGANMDPANPTTQYDIKALAQADGVVAVYRDYEDNYSCRHDMVAYRNYMLRNDWAFPVEIVKSGLRLHLVRTDIVDAMGQQAEGGGEPVESDEPAE